MGRRKYYSKIEENLQNLENIKDNINDIGALIKIDLSKKIVSNIKYNKNIIDKNFDLKKIDPKSGCWRKCIQSQT